MWTFEFYKAGVRVEVHVRPYMSCFTREAERVLFYAMNVLLHHIDVARCRRRQ